MVGELKGFDLDEYLGDTTESNVLVPWAVGGDVVPDSGKPAAASSAGAKGAAAASAEPRAPEPGVVEIGATSESQVRVLVVMDYSRLAQRALPAPSKLRAVRGRRRNRVSLRRCGRTLAGCEASQAGSGRPADGVRYSAAEPWRVPATLRGWVRPGRSSRRHDPVAAGSGTHSAGEEPPEPRGPASGRGLVQNQVRVVCKPEDLEVPDRCRRSRG